jgi:hypothetical protein
MKYPVKTMIMKKEIVADEDVASQLAGIAK